MSKTSKTIDKKRLTVAKSFRLFDFHVYDESPQKEDSGSDASSTEGTKPSNKDDQSFVIQMFGVNEKGDTCCIYVNDFQPFFFVKVGDNWDDYTARTFIDFIKKGVQKRYNESIASFKLVERQKLYGFSGGKSSKFIQIVFKNTTAMNRYKNLWYDYNQDGGDGNYRKRKPFIFNKVSIELYESNIPPLLRYFHIHNISPSGWVSFNTNRVLKAIVPTTTCTYEYICPLKELVPQPEKETRVPYKICSFDIEASSSHGDFPVPIKSYKRLATNLVDVFIKQSSFIQESMRKRFLLKILMTAFGYDNCDDVDLVYPKVTPSKDRVKALVQILCDKTLDQAKKANTEEDNSHLLTIDSIFDKIKETHTRGGGEADGDGDDAEEGANGAEQVEEIETKKTAYKRPTNPDEKKLTILDLLFSDKYDRDEKIQMSNDVLTMLFPKLEGDKVTFIGSTFMRYGETQPYMNHCLVLGSCDPVENVAIESVNTEQELLIKWTDLIQKENPDIIIGYNIFGFDYEFMFRRAQENECVRQFLLLSRKMGDLCAKQNRDTGELTIENTKLSIASGEYDLRFFKMTGRLQIDMYAYFRRDFNLSSYKLDDVAGQFIGDDVKRVECIVHPEFGEVTELYSQNLMGLNVGDFIHIELSSFTTDYYKDGKKFRVLAIETGREVTETIKGKEAVNKYNVILIGGHENIEKGKSIKWGMAKDDVTPQDIFRLAERDASGRAIVAKYCIQDCNLVHHLMNKIDVLTGYTEMASICSVPISFLVFRGQGIKLTSFVAKKCREKNTLMPDLEKMGDADGYEGAIVLPPKCSMYMDIPVACVDYASLYPSGMISQNYSHDSEVWTKEYNLAGELIRVTGERDKSGRFIYDDLPDYEYIDIEFDTFKYIRKSATSRAEKTKVGKIICRWAQFPDGKKGIMPSILEELLKARSDTRKMIKTVKDPFMQNILDKRQLGYKVTANSLYGQCGSRTSTFYQKNVAASTTATGRMMITYAKRIIEEVYGNMVYETALGPVRTKAEYIYGDTDSVFFTFNLENPDTGEKVRGKTALEMTIEIAQDAAKLCSQWLKAPMELTYEKTLMPFILLSKKRYVGILYETDPNKGKMKFMGLSIKRRDSCDYLKDVYGGILNILMDTKQQDNIKRAIDYLDNALTELVDGRVPMDKLAITKALRGYYKNPQQIGHNVLAERIGKRDPGNKPKAGDRMKFLFVVNDNPKALMGDKIETPEFIVGNKLQIDYNHYITNQLMKPLQQLFGLALIQIWQLQGKSVLIKSFQQELKKLEAEYPDLETFMKQKEKLCSKKIKVLLFDKVLTKIYNQQNNIQPISKFFRPVK